MNNRTITLDEAVEAFNQAGKGMWEDVELAKSLDDDMEVFRDRILDEIEPIAEDLEAAGFSEQQAKVAAMKDLGLTHPGIALILDVHPGTVGHYLSLINDKRENAEQLIRVLDAYGIEL